MTAVGLLLIGKPQIGNWRIRLHTVDWFFVAFLLITLLYAAAPIGQATISSKLVGLKNILLLGLSYFLGRNSSLKALESKKMLQVVILIGVVACVFTIIEFGTYTHFQSISGFARYNEDINEIDPRGHYDLAYTFQTSFAKKRFAAFFSNPLELASAMLLSFAAALFLLVNSKFESTKWLYFVGAVSAVLALYFSFSRSSMVALVMVLFLAAVLKKYYRLIASGVLAVLAIAFYIAFLAGADLRNFVVDTLTFQNPSSFGHLVSWFEGIESMIANPMGLGLGTSGSGTSVENELRVSGENQFLIFGVQLGVVGLYLYLQLLVASIIFCVKTFRKARSREEQMIPFVAACVKFGLLMPAMTSNIETYLYIALISWWMVGYSIQTYRKISTSGEGLALNHHLS